jgi:fatty-acyl-CoA synthase
MALLDESFRAAAPANRGVTIMTDDGLLKASWRDICDEGAAAALGLFNYGSYVGERVAVLGSSSIDTLRAMAAVWITGAAVVPLPGPARGVDLAAYAAATSRRLVLADCRLLIVGRTVPLELLDQLPGKITVLEAESLVRDSSRRWEEVVRVGEESVALIQFTSGSTTEPRGVVLSHGQLMSNITGGSQRLRIRADDVFMSWLPLYHDMGLIGMFLGAFDSTADLVLLPPEVFIRRPRLWMETVARFGATVTAAPNFAYRMAARGLHSGSPLDLSTLRVCINGSEPISAQVCRDFCEAGVRHRLAPTVFEPAYGMAELGVAGLLPEPGSELRTESIELVERSGRWFADYVPAGAPRSVETVSVGQPIAGLEARVAAPEDGRVCDPRELGELELAGTSVMTGYLHETGAPSSDFRGRWMRTGDAAYRNEEGDFFICGRVDDTVVIGGRNVMPSDVERVVEALDGVRDGCAAAFGYQDGRGETRLGIAFEATEPRASDVADSIRRYVTQQIGVAPSAVAELPKGSLPKTSSGKRQRAAARQMVIGSSNTPNWPSSRDQP